MTALLLVDLQNDFMPGGALGVRDALSVIPVANDLATRADLTVATQDWHPRNHLSFAANHFEKSVGDEILLDGVPQTLWPVHCVQGTSGAEFVDGLDLSRIDAIVQKGCDPKCDSYSGFFDNARQHETSLRQTLEEARQSRLIVMGVATDYCVQFTVLDALKLGFETHLALPGCRAVNLRAGDESSAIDAMQKAGAVIHHDLTSLPF